MVGNIVYGLSLAAVFVGLVLLAILVSSAIQEAARSLDFRAYAGFALALISIGFASAWTLAHRLR